MTTDFGQQTTTDAGPGARLALPATMTDVECVRRANACMREWVGTRRVWRGPTPPRSLPRRLVDLDPVVTPDLLDQLHTVGLVVLHNGSIAYERYFHGFAAHQTYQLASISKVFVGLVNSILADQGVIDRAIPVRRYVPQLAGTSFGEATVEDLTDMQVVGQLDDHAYTHRGGARPLAEIIAGTSDGRQVAPTTVEWLSRAQLSDPPGSQFSYDNGTTEALEWVVRAATGKDFATLMSELIWSRIGAEEDADIALDADGTELSSHGVATTLRDLARFGDLLRTDGHNGTEQVIPVRVVRDIIDGESAVAGANFARSGFVLARDGVGYNDYWYLRHDESRTIEAVGRNGQWLRVSPGTGLVIAHLAAAKLTEEHVRLADQLHARITEHFSAVAELTAAAGDFHLAGDDTSSGSGLFGRN